MKLHPMLSMFDRLQTAAILMAAALLSVPAWAETRVISIPNYQVKAGEELEVPVVLDNAAGLASLQVQINFNRQVIELIDVRTGPLGAQFEMSRGDGDGFTQLTFVRGNALTSGAGRLCALKFRANDQAPVDLQSELAIANTSYSDASGVIDLRQTDQLTLSNGQVSVSASQGIDNAANGLPDWWEKLHGLDPFGNSETEDPEKDGLVNLLEYAFGANPNAVDAHQRGVQAGEVENNGESFLSIGFFRRKGNSGLLYHVEESTNLGLWQGLSLPQQTYGAPQDMGDGTEYVEVRGTLPLTGPSAAPKGFLRVGVEKP